MDPLPRAQRGVGMLLSPIEAEQAQQMPYQPPERPEIPEGYENFGFFLAAVGSQTTPTEWNLVSYDNGNNGEMNGNFRAEFVTSDAQQSRIILVHLDGPNQGQSITLQLPLSGHQYLLVRDTFFKRITDGSSSEGTQLTFDCSSDSDFGSINYWKRTSKRHRPVGGWKETTVARFYKLYQQAKKV